MTGLRLVDEVGLSLRVSYGEQGLLRYAALVGSDERGGCGWLLTMGNE
jgi:hypothetical protein